MDPFSIVVGTASLIDISWRVGNYLRDVHEAAGEVEGEITSLAREIQSLDSVNKSIKNLHEVEIEVLPENLSEIPDQARDLWQNTVKILQDCHATVEKLKVILEAIIGKEGVKVTGWRDGIKKQLRKQSKDGALNQIRLQLSTHRDSLHISLTSLDLLYTRKGSENFQRLGFQLQRQIAALRSSLPLTDKHTLQDSLSSAAAVASSLHLNKHFDPPKAVSSIFTGRKAYLDGLKQALDSSLSSSGNDRTRKRFVVFGLGGSGKTQFCCKFASEYKQRFWGVFTIDASSHENARQSFVAIAKIAGVDPNERAAKSWLSSSEKPWLLLIDNANDTNLEIESYFPDSEQGLTLITTRNPSVKMHGTIGKCFYHFERLEEEEASELLLKAAEQKDPWTPQIMHWASTITKKLGALPLALIHAGQAIKAKYCGLKDYLTYYDQSWDLIRQNQRMTGYRGGADANMEEYLKVYASYEIVYRGFENMEYQRFQDAVQILKLFSFLHHENIPFDILIAAARHPRIEREAQNRDEELRKAEENDNAKRKPLNVVQQPKSWPKYLRELAFGILKPLFMDRSPTILPTFLRDAELSTTPDDCKVRLRKALYELTQLSLITHHETTDSYSMHPLVHTWVRERPQMTTQDQAIWCEAAITTLSRCILLPSSSNSVESHTDLSRQLLPHLVAVEKRQEKIRAAFANNQKKRKKLWPILKSGIYPQMALRLAKSSLVYSHCGYFEEAEIRQRIVMEYVCRMRGSDHPRAMDITLALSGTLWQQTRTNEAAELQNQVLQACLKSLGPDHPRTLKVMDTLGESRRQQGRFTESLELHAKAIRGMKLTLPETDPAVFHALDHLGLTLCYCFRFEDARQHQEMAVAGLKRLLGEADLKTLSAIESLAMTCMELGTEYLKTDRELGGQYLDTAHKDMLFVIEERTKQLGDKQPYTWLAKCNLGRIKSAMGDLDEAEELISSLLPMAVGHLGEDHMGVLAGKNHLAKILVKQKRYTEAEEMLLDISRPEKYAKTTTATGEHPDRCEALWNLVDCYQKQGKIDDGLRTCDELSTAVVTMRRGGKKTESSSTFWQMIQDKRAELQDARSASTTELESTTVELRPATLKPGVLAVSSDTQVVTTAGDLRQRGSG